MYIARHNESRAGMIILIKIVKKGLKRYALGQR